MNLVVIDDSFEGRADLSTQNPAGLSVNIFKQNPNEFPAVKQVGDIVQFRHFKVNIVSFSLFINSCLFLFRFNIMNLIFKHYPQSGQHLPFFIRKMKMGLGKYFQDVKFIRKNLKWLKRFLI